jgi:hypothetical protein
MAAQKTPNSNRPPNETKISAEAPDSVLPAAYALAKAKTAQDAVLIMQAIPKTLYGALKAHMNARPNLFLPEVRKAVERVIESPKMSKAEALFA